MSNVSSPRKGLPADLMQSLFAVHGLGGDKFGTWTENGLMWLRNFLLIHIPEARKFTYGYDCILAFSKSSAEVDDFARELLHQVQSQRKSARERARPMIFICHSLGGILFKQVGNYFLWIP